MSQRPGTPVPWLRAPEKHRVKPPGRAVGVTGRWPDSGKEGTRCDLA